MTYKLYLTVIEPEAADSILVNETGEALLKGDEDENLACGACKAVLVQGMGTHAFYNMFAAPSRLLIQCKCGAHNLVPSHSDSQST